MDILTILIFPGHEYGISCHQSILWQTPICPLYLWVYLLQRCGIAFHLLMPFSAFSVSVSGRLSLRVFTSLLQTPFFLYLSTFTVREIKWTTLIPVHTETTYWSFKKSKFLKTAKSPSKILCEEIYFGMSGVERLGNKLSWLGSSAGTSCCWDTRRVRRQRAEHCAPLPENCPVSARLSADGMETPDHTARTTVLSLSETYVRVSGRQKGSHICFSEILDSRNKKSPLPLAAWWSLCCNFNIFKRSLAMIIFFSYLTLKRSHITIWRDIRKLVF